MQLLEQARAAADRSLALFETIGRQGSSKFAALLKTFISILVDEGRNEEARVALERDLRLCETLGDAGAGARAKALLAELEFAAGNLPVALAMAEEGTRTFAQLGDLSALAQLTVNFAAYLFAAGRLEQARTTAIEALKLAISVDNATYLTVALQHVGTSAALAGDARRGANLLNFVDHWLKAEGIEREFTEKQSYDLGIAAVRAALPEAEAATLLTSETQLSTQEAISLALIP
jgi:tetratricopeptide (TPR) repeat protein